MLEKVQVLTLQSHISKHSQTWKVVDAICFKSQWIIQPETICWMGFLERHEMKALHE